MTAVITGILKESRDYYRNLKRELVGKLILNSGGSLITKSIRGGEYLYIRKNIQKKRIDLYVGPKTNYLDIEILQKLNSRKRNIKQFRESKLAMKELRVDRAEIINEDYLPSLRSLFEQFEKDGLWDECLQIIGSWCFIIYQNNFGVEFYPERTLDIDMGVKIPYKGRPIDLSKILKSMGFDEQFDYQSDIVKFRCSDFIIEFLQYQQGDGARRKKGGDAQDLGITTQALPYLNILLDNPTILIARDLGRVCVPSMPAFVAHKLIVAACRRDVAKKIKDYKQVEAVCKTIAWNPKEIADLAEIATRMHKSWCKKMVRSFSEMSKYVPDSMGTGRALALAGLIPPVTG